MLPLSIFQMYLASSSSKLPENQLHHIPIGPGARPQHDSFETELWNMV